MDERDRQQQDTDAEHSPEGDRTLQFLQAPPEEPIAQEQQPGPSDNKEAMSTYERASRRIQGFIALVTTIYVILVGLQWHAMKETLQVSKNAIEFSKTSLEMTKRPWVVLTRVTTDAPFQAQRAMQVRAVLKNVGETPAMAFSGSIQWQRQLAGAQISCDDSPEKSVYTIGPHEETFFDTTVSEQPQPITDLIMKDTGNLAGTGVLVLYICGKVTYQDIFGSAHYTDFCAFYSPRREMFMTCLQGNTAR
jgi:hypothetical protein